ncbi:MAG: dephospho-CoA kinase [Bacteroidetes bacterium]|nr:dephospho-CoA kinase [Bacteroidota bacterium]
MILGIGLTGGIGSGKSTVAAIFEVLGIPVYYSDDAAKKIMNNDTILRKKIIANFGKDAYHDGILNRSYLGKQVFNNKEKLALLNSLVHPATIRDGIEWMQRQTTPYAIKEAALIFESGSQKGLDYVIGVYAPESLRIDRTVRRDHITAEAVKLRMQNQMNEEEKMKLCNFIIHNDEEQPILPQVLSLHEQLLELAKNKLLVSKK